MPFNCLSVPREGGNGLAFWRLLEFENIGCTVLNTELVFMRLYSFLFNIPFHPFLFSMLFSYYFVSSNRESSGNTVRSDKSL